MFRSECVVFLGGYNRDYFNKVMDELSDGYGGGDKFSTPKADACCWDCGHNQVVWVGPGDHDSTIRSLAHEAVHAAFGSANSIGFKDHLESQEYHAYYVGRLLEECLDKLL